MMSIVATLPVYCRYCGEEIENTSLVADLPVWVDVRLSSEGGEHEYCPMAPYATHLPDRPELTV
jgi:hypothetical protein